MWIAMFFQLLSFTQKQKPVSKFAVLISDFVTFLLLSSFKAI